MDENKEDGSLVQKLRGRATYLRDKGSVKTSGLLEQAAAEIERLTRLVKNPVMKIRRHRGSYAESVETIETIPATVAGVREYLKRQETYLFDPAAKIEVRFYAKSDRGWGDDYIVLVDSLPVGFCSSLLVD